MIPVVRFLFTLLLMANLAACAVAYRHPDYEFNSPEDQLNFDKDRAACEALHARQHCTELKEKASIICEGNGNGSHKCREVVPKQCTVDTPEQCLRRKGWRRADINGTYLE